MPFISKIEARAYARATEIFERVSKAVLHIFPEDIRSNVSMTTSSAEGQAGDSIFIITGLLEGEERCEAVFNFILREMGIESKRALKRSIELRLDEGCVFFLRIDKQTAYLGEVKLTDRADVISVRFHFRDYPRCRRNDVLQMIESRLQPAEESKYES